MSGHNKWSSIKHKKAKEDAKRGKLFSRLVKLITVAARQGGGDIEGNPALRQAVEMAKAANVPKDNIIRAIKRGTGEIKGVNYTQKIYEGYGPGGVAIIVEALTDNVNRTSSEIRSIFAKNGGNLGESGCVAWMFVKEGYVIIDGSFDEDTLMELAVEIGAKDYDISDNIYTITTAPEDLHKVLDGLREKGIVIEESGIRLVPKNSVEVDGNNAKRLIKLLNELEDNDDVNQVYSNFEMSDELLESLT